MSRLPIPPLIKQGGELDPNHAGKRARLLSTASGQQSANTLPTRWTPVAFGVITLIGQIKQRDENMARMEAASNKRILQLHQQFAATQLAKMGRDPGKSRAARLEVVRSEAPSPDDEAAEEARREEAQAIQDGLRHQHPLGY